jgi:hypothetical protein
MPETDAERKKREKHKGSRKTFSFTVVEAKGHLDWENHEAQPVN